MSLSPEAQLAEPPAADWSALHSPPWPQKKGLMRARFQAVPAGRPGRSTAYMLSTPRSLSFHALTRWPQSNASKITIWLTNMVILEISGLNIARHSSSLLIFNTNVLIYGGLRKKWRSLRWKTSPRFGFQFSESFVCTTCIMHFCIIWRNSPLV